jgi:SAM-dependent methyltransferase
MHYTSMFNMKKCIDKYVTERFLSRRTVRIADIGAWSGDSDYNYRRLFYDHGMFNYTGVDIHAGGNVDVVLQDPYKLPFDDGAFDLVVSGQMFEHCEFFWMSFAEMVRVLRSDGYIFLIAPSSGPTHGVVDCWRFSRDAYKALAKWTDCECVESWRDITTTLQGGQRHVWHDMVGVFRHHPRSR